MKELSQQERRKQIYMKSLQDAVAESARNQKLADLFRAEHQRKEFADALNIHSTMSVMDLLKGDSTGTDQDEILRMETLGNLTKVMDDATADELWLIIRDNDVFVETLNSNWRDLYNKLVVQFADKKGSKSAIFNFIRNYIGQQTQFLNKQGAVEEEDWENLDEATTAGSTSSISNSRSGSSRSSVSTATTAKSLASSGSVGSQRTNQSFDVDAEVKQRVRGIFTSVLDDVRMKADFDFKTLNELTDVMLIGSVEYKLDIFNGIYQLITSDGLNPQNENSKKMLNFL
jgi:hypothetical protein